MHTFSFFLAEPCLDQSLLVCIYSGLQEDVVKILKTQFGSVGFYKACFYFPQGKKSCFSFSLFQIQLDQQLANKSYSCGMTFVEIVAIFFFFFKGICEWGSTCPCVLQLIFKMLLVVMFLSLFCFILFLYV